jgi:MoaA/NifB/PqqE/SkfB family radical SAM enzyme
MEWTLFTKIINDLKENKYTEWIALHNYNEPLINDRIFKEIELVTKLLPQSTSCIFTNGDYLSRDIIEELIESGLKYLRITIYPLSKNIEPTSTKLFQWIKKKKLTDLKWEYEEISENKGFNALCKYKNLTIEIISPNIDLYNNRGETSIVPIKNFIREHPCSLTENSAAIDYKGNFKMCCNIYADISEHKEYIIDNLTNNSFHDIWSSKRFNVLRKLHSNSDWTQSLICSTCSHSLRKKQLELL